MPRFGIAPGGDLRPKFRLSIPRSGAASFDGGSRAREAVWIRVAFPFGSVVGRLGCRLGVGARNQSPQRSPPRSPATNCPTSHLPLTAPDPLSPIGDPPPPTPRPPLLAYRRIHRSSHRAAKSTPSDSGGKAATVGENRTRFRCLWLSGGRAVCVSPPVAPTPAPTSLPTATSTAAPTTRRKAHPATRVARPRR
jgi:hypothetical protein